MKAVILAAGQGTRIRSVHGERPKCLIEVDESTILDHQLDALSLAGIDDVAIVVGYEKEQIKTHVNRRNPGSRQRIQFIETEIPGLGREFSSSRTQHSPSPTISIHSGWQRNGFTVTVSSV